MLVCVGRILETIKFNNQSQADRPTRQRGATATIVRTHHHPARTAHPPEENNHMKNAMSIRTLTRAACALALVGAAALTLNTFAGDPAAKQDGTAPHLPPGMTEADMKAMMDAATPGPMHAYLAKDSGTWNGANKYWMTPNAPPQRAQSLPRPL